MYMKLGATEYIYSIFISTLDRNKKEINSQAHKSSFFLFRWMPCCTPSWVIYDLRKKSF